MIKRGKSENKFIEVVEMLTLGTTLPPKYRDHKLIGQYEGTRELHLEPDWLLIYRLTKDSLILERTGTHSDLFN